MLIAVMTAVVMVGVVTLSCGACIELIYKCSGQAIGAKHRHPAGGEAGRHVAAWKQTLQKQRCCDQRQQDTLECWHGAR